MPPIKNAPAVQPTDAYKNLNVSMMLLPFIGAHTIADRGGTPPVALLLPLPLVFDQSSVSNCSKNCPCATAMLSCIESVKVICVPWQPFITNLVGVIAV